MGRPINKGMWAKDEQGRVGIATRDDVFGKNGVVLIDHKTGLKVEEPTFHLVDELGATKLVVYRSWEGLVQAEYSDIPEPRREGLSRPYAASLGYV